MKVGIVGSGAVGGYFGAKLALIGQEVVFFSRGKLLRQLKRNGLIFETLGKKYVIKNAIFTDDPGELKDCKYILFTVKSYDTKTTINRVERFISQDALVITPQNGINNDLILAESLGKKRVIPGFTKIGVNTIETGHIRYTTGDEVLFIGEYSGEKSERLSKFAEIFRKSGVKVIISNQIQVERWKKYIWNCTFNIIAAITKLSLDQILSNVHLRQLCVDTIMEIESVAKKEGIDFGGENIVGTRIKIAEQMGRYKPSTLQDIERGETIELDALTGHLIALANKNNIMIPTNKTLYAILFGISQLVRPRAVFGQSKR
jgi:2-dehydropantoate 2-reductase